MKQNKQDYYSVPFKTAKIKSIHNSKLYGTIFEVGCGTAISSKLLNVDGASKTIYEVKIPYSKESQEEYYKGEDIRSVSKEFIENVLGVEFNYAAEIKKKTNFIIAASFQLQDSSQKTLTHGYIGIICNENQYHKKIYHVSIPDALTREEYLEIIGDIAINLLYQIDKVGIWGDAENEFQNFKYIDQVWDTAERPSFYNTFRYFSGSEESFIVFTPDKKLIRFEDLARGEGLILMKGSFNPIHEYHVLMIEDAKAKYNYPAAFSISINRFDKDVISYAELMQKIDAITSLGYHVVVNVGFKFSDILDFRNKRWPNLNIVFPIGMDTYNRIEGFSEEYENVNFLVFPRADIKYVQNPSLEKFSELFAPTVPDNGISSSKIRSGEHKSSLNKNWT